MHAKLLTSRVPRPGAWMQALTYRKAFLRVRDQSNLQTRLTILKPEQVSEDQCSWLQAATRDGSHAPT